MDNAADLQTEHLLVVINPTNDTYISLERAIITSQLRKVKPTLHLLFTVDEETTEPKFRNQDTFRDGDWLRAILKKLDDNNLIYTYEFCWSKEWYEGVLACAKKHKSDIIYIPDYKADGRKTLFSNSRWALLRQSECPVMIVRPGASSHRKTVLAAVNIQNESPDAIELNEKILTKGQAIANLYNADFHVTNSYTDSMHYPNRDRILNITGLPTSNVHTKEGDPAFVISFVANKIDADIVIIGTKSKQGALSIMKGNTSEKVLKELSQDVITYS